MRVYAVDRTEWDNVRVELHARAEDAVRELGDGVLWCFDLKELALTAGVRGKSVEYLEEMSPQVIGQQALYLTTVGGGPHVYAVEVE